MRIFDASSIIYAWDNYPVNQFPKLWQWLASEIESNQLCIAKIAFVEVNGKTPECATWLQGAAIKKIPETNDILTAAMRIKGLLGIQNDQYRSGVGENDILIIATAKVESMDLISDEKRQITLPQILAKYKIPAVCQLPDVSVECLNFLELIKQSGSTF